MRKRDTHHQMEHCKKSNQAFPVVHRGSNLRYARVGRLFTFPNSKGGATDEET